MPNRPIGQWNASRTDQVYVEKDDLLYTCQWHEPIGWICGQCGRGDLGHNPKLLYKCHVCRAVVREKSELNQDPRKSRRQYIRCVK